MHEGILGLKLKNNLVRRAEVYFLRSGGSGYGKENREGNNEFFHDQI